MSSNDSFEQQLARLTNKTSTPVVSKNDDSSIRDTQKKQRTDVKPTLKKPHRTDKNMPLEMTAKRPVGRYRPVVEMKTTTRVTDPRFLDHAGQFNDELYKRSYGFIADYQQEELAALKKKLTKTKNTELRVSLSKQIEAAESRSRAAREEDRRKRVVREWRKEEEELVKKGKKPHYLKDSDVKKLVLLDKYEEMKGKDVSSKSFEKLLEKRRKKTASKERKSLPFTRRSAE